MKKTFHREWCWIVLLVSFSVVSCRQEPVGPADQRLAEFVWEKLNGPMGGDVRIFAFPGSEFVFGLSESKFHRSSDGGTTWEYLVNIWFSSLVTTPSGVLFGGVGYNGVYRSTDNGNSWVPTTLASGNITFMGVGSQGTLFAAVENAGIDRTTDNGQTWTRAVFQAGFRCFSADTTGLVLAGTSVGLFRSTDNGLSWGESELEDSYDLYSLCITQSGAVLGGTSSNLFRSTDGGGSWISTGLRTYIRSIIDVFGIQYALGTGGLYKSSNDGLNWVPTNESVALGRRLTANGDGSLFFETVGAGGFRSTDQGVTWVQVLTSTPMGVYALAVTPSDVLLAGTQNGVYRSTDSGNQWVPCGLTLKDVHCFGEQTDGTLAAGTSYGIYFSTNGGLVWTAGGLQNQSVLSTVFTVSGRILAGTESGLFISSDGGTTWTKKVLGNSSVVSLSAFWNNIYGACVGTYRSSDEGMTWEDAGVWNYPNVVYANGGAVFSGGNGIFRSTNNGLAWKAGNLENVTALYTDRAGGYIAGTNDGVFRASQEGMTWQPAGLTGKSIYCVTVNSAGLAFAASYDGFYRGHR